MSETGPRAVVFIRDVAFILIASLLISVLVKTFLFRSFYIPSESMENTLIPNDHVVVSLLSPHVMPLHRGDVVVFSDPGGWLDSTATTRHPPSPLDKLLILVGVGAENEGNHLIKRVIGLPGDTVACCDAQGGLTLNGAHLAQPFAKLRPGAKRADPYTFRVTVPRGDIWVMGDNRDDSRDSAYHAATHDVSPFVPLRNVVGQAVAISWPISRWAILDSYPAVFRRAQRPVH